MQQKELPLKNEEFYSFEFLGGINNDYNFITIHEVVYAIKFKPSAYIFTQHTSFAEYIFEFSLLLISRPEGKFNIASDQRIPKTVLAIFLNFFERCSNNICVDICDSSDSKQFVRKKKFDRWYNNFNPGGFSKLDEVLIDSEGVQYPVAVILKSNNPFKLEVFKAFSELVLKTNNEK